MENTISRRNFVAGTAAAAVAAASLSTAPVFADDATQWEAEADLVIVGAGAAGFSALATTYIEGLGSALLLEAADKEEEMGGNSRVCGQGVFCPMTVEAAIAYQTKCNGSYVVAPELMQAWAENICENVEWMEANVGFEGQVKGSAEFPEFDETGEVVWYAHQGMGPWQHTWQLFVDAAAEYNAPVYMAARAIRLVKNAEGVICGVECEDGRKFKANKGVILACGGFENNQEMMNNYMEIGFPGYKNQGTPWNRGDGIKMAMSAGADLWHMNNVSGNGLWAYIGLNDPTASGSISVKTKDYIYVSGDGYRFANENETSRHGKVYRAGTWAGKILPEKAFIVMTQNAMENATCGAGGWYARTEGYELAKSGQELLDNGLLTKCDTVEDLAAFIGCPVEHIADCIEGYNAYVAEGVDMDFHRETPFDADNPAFTNTKDAEHLDRIELLPIEAPFYVTALHGTVLNTQGGPRRGAKGEVLDVEGNPIPRLYAAGEMGCIYGYAYNLGGNFSEAISSGRLAARSASALEPIA